jgi:hypothetical protein
MEKVSYQKLITCECRSSCPYCFPANLMEVYATNGHFFVFIKLTSVTYQINSFKIVLTELDAQNKAISSRIIASHGLTIKAKKSLVIDTPIPLSTGCASLFMTISHIATPLFEWDYEEMMKKRQEEEQSSKVATPLVQTKEETTSAGVVPSVKEVSPVSEIKEPLATMGQSQVPNAKKGRRHHRSFYLPNHFSRVVLTSSLIVLGLVSIVGVSSANGSNDSFSYPDDGELDPNYHVTINGPTSFYSPVTSNGLTFGLALDNGVTSYYVTNFSASSGNTVTIPAQIGNYTVAGIAPGAFKNSTVKYVYFYSDNLTIGDEAFLGSSLIQFSKVNNNYSFSLKSIGTRAFADCDYLSFFNCQSISSLGDRAFEACDQLASFTQSTGTATTMVYKGSPFYNCPKLATYDSGSISAQPNGSSVTPLFQDCKKLAVVTLSVPNVSFDSITFSNWLIKGSYFQGLNLTINRVTSLGSAMFLKSKLNSLVISGNFAVLPSNLITDNPSFASLTITSNQSVTVESSLVKNCDNFSSFESNNLYRINSGAFEGCRSLRKVFLPSMGVHVLSNAFPSWTRIYYPTTNKYHKYGYYYGSNKNVEVGLIKLGDVTSPSCTKQGHVLGSTLAMDGTYLETDVPTTVHLFSGDKCLTCEQDFDEINEPLFGLTYHNNYFVNKTIDTDSFSISDDGYIYDSLTICSTNNEELSVGFFASFENENGNSSFLITGSQSFNDKYTYSGFFILTVNPGANLTISVRDRKSKLSISGLSIH